MNTRIGLTRRQFLKSNMAAALAVSGFPTIIPGSALGKNGAVAPSERVAVGGIGVGERGQQVLTHFLQQKTCQVVALCDVKQEVLAGAKAMVDESYQNKDCRSFGDFRELTAREDIDAVLIASTDHWHVLHALAAVRAGKDIYVEKPLGLSLAEDQALRGEVHQRQRVFQFGTQQRSGKEFRFACELVRNGHIGRLQHINVWAPGSAPGGSTKEIAPPATLDYDFWLGAAAFRPYTEDLTAFGADKKTWWFNRDFALGWIAGWGIHPLDIALWGAGERADGTVDIAGQGNFPAEGACNTATTWDIDFNFKTGLTMKFVGAPFRSPTEKFLHQAEWTRRYGKITDHGTAFEGADGWILVSRSGLITNPGSLADLELEAGKFPAKLVHSADHVLSFLEAVRSRQPTVSPIDAAVRSDAFCHVADIAIRLRRQVRYDGSAEKFIGDEQANQRLGLRPMRAPWKI